MKNTNKVNNIVKEETTVRSRKTNRKFIASVCAVVAATAMITGVAVFTASAEPIKSAPDRTITATIKMEKTDPAEKQADQVDQNGKHPGEAGYRYYENEKAAQQADQVNANG